MTQTSTLPSHDPTLVSALSGGEASSRRDGVQLKGNMGTLHLVFSVLSYNAPLAVLAIVVALVIGYGIGVGAPLLFVGLGLVMGLFAVGYTAMSRHLPHPGAFYSYVTAGLGRPIGLGASFVALLSYALVMFSLVMFTGMAVESLIHKTLHGPDISWWIWSLLFIAAAGVLGYRRIDVSARVLGILLGLELIIVLIWDAVVLGTRGGAGELTYSSFNPHVAMAGSVSVGLIFAVSCFSGFEATAIFRDEVREPTKTVPRATYLIIALLTVFYAVSSWAFVQAFGDANAVAAIGANPSNAFFDMVTKYLGIVGYHLVTVLIITSGFAGLMAYHNVLSRYLFNLGADGILHRGIGTPHETLHSPHRASLLLTTLASLFVIGIVVVGADPTTTYVQLTGLSGYALIILFALAAIGIASYLVRDKSAGLSLWQRAIAPISAAILMVGIAIMATLMIDLLTGSATLSTISLVITYGAVAGGILLAIACRKFKPEVYASIGRQ